MILLSVQGLRKSYRALEGAVRAVQDIAFDVGAKEFFALLGPSGCGKTTTLRCIAGLERPDAGEIHIAGEVVAAPDRGVFVPTHRRDIGMVFQSYAIWPHLSVHENVAYPLRVQRPRPSSDEITRRVMETLSLVGMASMARRPATDLSGGQQQRVALARALIRRPKLLLLDEPLSNLDARLREQMRHELKELVEQVGITTVYVTHDQVEALSMADRVAVMVDGQIAQVGAPREVYEAPASERVASFLGSANVLHAVVVQTDADGATVAIAGNRLRVRLGGADRPVAGAALDLLVRPEDLTVAVTRQREADVAGVIERVAFHGPQIECRVRVGSAVVRLVAHPATPLARGTEVWVSLVPDRCVALPCGGHHGDPA